MNKADFDKIEKHLGVTLPDYYKNFHLNYPSELYEEFGEYELISYPEKIISETQNAWQDLWGKPLDRSYLVIGENGCGDCFVISLKQNNGVFTFLHEIEKFCKLTESFEEYHLLLKEDALDSKIFPTKSNTCDLRTNLNGEANEKTEKRSWFNRLFFKS